MDDTHPVGTITPSAKDCFYVIFVAKQGIYNRTVRRNGGLAVGYRARANPQVLLKGTVGTPQKPGEIGNIPGCTQSGNHTKMGLRC